MPYIDGRRVSNDEWTATYGSIKQFHTGPDGENPADAPDLDAETAAPKAEKRAGSKRSSKSQRKVAAAIATATGQELPDLTGLDATPAVPAADGAVLTGSDGSEAQS